MKNVINIITNKHNPKQHFVELLSGVFIMAWAASFSKLIQLPSIQICFWRTMIAACASLICVVLLKQKFVIKEKKDVAKFCMSSVFYAITFYGLYESVKLAGITVGIMSFYTYPLFTVILEPLYFKQRMKWKDGLVGIGIFLGLILTTLNIGFDVISISGILWGLAGSMGYAMRSIISKSLVLRYTSFQILSVQYSMMTLLFIPFILMNPVMPGVNELGLLLILGSIVTVGGTLLYTRSLVSFSAKKATVISGMEPVIGLGRGGVFFNEVLSGTTLLGIVIVIGAIFIEGFRVMKTSLWNKKKVMITSVNEPREEKVLKPNYVEVPLIRTQNNLKVLYSDHITKGIKKMGKPYTELYRCGSYG